MKSSERSNHNAWLVAATVLFLLTAALPVAWGQTAPTPTVKFLSPTSFHGEVPTVTDDDDLNSSFRLSAWVANAPSGSLVEFELVPGDGLTKPMTIGGGQPVTGDTFEYQWDIAEGPTGVLEGQHTLRATLYDTNGEALAVDSVTVNILHGETPQTGGESAIDMTYPVSGGPLGQYPAANGKTNSVFDVPELTVATVEAWFTTAAPGTAPVWRQCNDGESDTQYPDGVRCTYPADDPATKDVNEAVDPAKVTAVALLVAGDDGSADVARVIPYTQEPSGMRFDLFGRADGTGALDVKKPGSVVRAKDPNNPNAGFGCSDWIRLKVMDQVGRTIAGGNIDVHAQGPSDQLKFHTSYISALNPALYQAPSDGHAFPEKGTKCVAHHDAIAQQGEHPLGGLPDRKHIESTLGTRDNGTFDLAFESDQAGTTQVTAWVDKKDDDKFCTGETSASAALGWGSEPSGSNAEQPSDCAVVTPPPVEEPEFDGSRVVAIEPAATSVKAGRSVAIVGSIDAADELCQAGQTLRLKARRPSSGRFRTIATATTDSFGLAGFSAKVERTKLYRVVAPAAGECALAKSTIKKVRAI